MAKTFSILSITEGKILNPAAFQRVLLGLKDGKYKVEIAKMDQRSLQQNRYYFGLVIPMIQKGIYDMGTEITKEECHEFLKAKFNYVEVVNEATAEYVQIPRSTTAMNKEEFCLYIEKIQRFAIEFLNIVIPDPSTQMSISYQD